mmetsp:Transcript_26207/g.43012  ORF Transcript_26207/g.43012 Transcript_26207/m.43012 type:complete len:92 (+) Transcript_26207:1275-1550(+)
MPVLFTDTFRWLLTAKEIPDETQAKGQVVVARETGSDSDTGRDKEVANGLVPLKEEAKAEEKVGKKKSKKGKIVKKRKKEKEFEESAPDNS